MQQVVIETATGRVLRYGFTDFSGSLGPGESIIISDFVFNPAISEQIWLWNGTTFVAGTRLAVSEVPQVFALEKRFNAGVQDVAVYDANAPYPLRIWDLSFFISTPGPLTSTVQLRTASAGGGSPLSNALAADRAGRVRDNAAAAITEPPLVPVGGSIWIRKSDASIVGNLVALISPIRKR